jgi:hypothetical protein
MQKNNIEGRSQAEEDEQKEEQRQGPLTQHHKEISFLLPALPFPFFSRFFSVSFCCHWFIN